MRIHLKQKLTVGISVLVILTMILSVLPITSTEVQAASSQMNWYDGDAETSMIVEAGSKFYIGDFVMVLSGNSSATASMVKASYKSARTKVASVNSKGNVSAKKAGTTDITVKYQGNTILCHLTVEKKGSFGKDEAITKMRAAAKTLAKKMPSKLNASRGFSLINNKNAYLNAYRSYSIRQLSYEGFLYTNERPAGDLVDYGRSEKLAVPEAGRYLTAEAMLRQFMKKNDPTSKQSSKTMSIASARASTKSITIKLKKKLTADQILAAQLAYPGENSTIGSKTRANITMTIYDVTAGKYYKGQLTLKKGRNQLTVKPVIYTYGKYDAVKLIKGHVYMLESTMSWANGTKVTAK